MHFFDQMVRWGKVHSNGEIKPNTITGRKHDIGRYGV